MNYNKPIKWTKISVNDPKIVYASIGARTIEEIDEVLSQIRKNHPNWEVSIVKK